MSGEEELYDYYFSDALLSRFAQNFRMDEIISKFISSVREKKTDQIENVAKQVLGEYSQKLTSFLVKSEKDSLDRTGEIMYQVAEKTGVIFPSIPQRLIELAFMSTRPQDRLLFPIATTKELVLRVAPCAAYSELKKNLGEEKVRGVPCKYGCIANSKTLFDGLRIAVKSEIKAKMSEKGYCEFEFQLQG
nr:hypothetical protein [Candidatus Njordarchaeum guaymaensis]